MWRNRGENVGVNGEGCLLQTIVMGKGRGWGRNKHENEGKNGEGRIHQTIELCDLV